MHWRRNWQPTPVFLPGESQGWGSLVGCRLWGCTESDTTDVTQQEQTYRRGLILNKCGLKNLLSYGFCSKGRQPMHSGMEEGWEVRQVSWKRSLQEWAETQENGCKTASDWHCHWASNLDHGNDLKEKLVPVFMQVNLHLTQESEKLKVGSGCSTGCGTRRVGSSGSGREVQERGDICILTVDSHCCTAETNTTL